MSDRQLQIGAACAVAADALKFISEAERLPTYLEWLKANRLAALDEAEMTWLIGNALDTLHCAAMTAGAKLERGEL